MNDSDVGKRLDVFVSESEEITRTAAQRLIENGYVRVNGAIKDKNYRLREGDNIECDDAYDEPEPSDAPPENIPLEIVYEDGDIIVVNKPKGLVVHPSAGHSNGTLVNALLYHCAGQLSGIGGVIRPGIVHRIDMDTSGLIVAAKNDFAHLSLAAQLKEHKAGRFYEAIVQGRLREPEGVIDAGIGRHPFDRKKMAVTRGGREAVTHYQVVTQYNTPDGAFSHLKLRLETGRTHQIRVHMAYIGHPCIGDTLYGGDGTKFARRYADILHGQCLHARTLELTHPRNGELMSFTSELPEYFKFILNKLENISNE